MGWILLTRLRLSTWWIKSCENERKLCLRHFCSHLAIGKCGLAYIVYCFLCVCLFVRLRISPPRIKLAASNFARRFIGVQGRESPIFVNFAPRKPKIGRINQRATTSTTFITITLWLPNTWSHGVWLSRIGMCVYIICYRSFRWIEMCVYMSVPLTYLFLFSVSNKSVCQIFLHLMNVAVVHSRSTSTSIRIN